MNIIKKRDFDIEKARNIYKHFLTIGSYEFYLNENNNILLGGIKLIDLAEFTPVFSVFRIKYINKLNETEKNEILEYFEEKNIYYSVGLITLRSLRNFKYTENLNILNLHFDNKFEAFFMIEMLEKLRHINYRLDIQNEHNIIKEIDKKTETKNEKEIDELNESSQ
jgi:hypothetical protein